MCLFRGLDTHVYCTIGTQDQNNQLSWTDAVNLDGWQCSTGVSLCKAADPVTGEQVLFAAYANKDGHLYVQRYCRDAKGDRVWTRYPEPVASNLSDSTPRLIMYGGKLWCIFRGMNDPHLYYSQREDTSAGEKSWSRSKSIAEAESGTGPGAVEWDGSLYTVYKNSRNSTLRGSRQVNPGDGWDEDFPVYEAGNTESTPSLLAFKPVATDGLTLFCVHSGSDSDNQIYTAILRQETIDGKKVLVANGSDFSNQTYKTQAGPTLVSLANRSDSTSATLYMFYRGDGREGWKYYSKWERRDPIETSIWTDQQRLGDEYGAFEIGVCSFDRAVTADIVVGTPTLMLAHRGPGGDDQVYWSLGVQDENNGVTWPQRRPLLGHQSISGVSVLTVRDPVNGNDVVFCVFAQYSEDDDQHGRLLCFRYFKDGANGYGWSRAEYINGNMSDRTPHLFMIGTELWCVHRGYDDPHMYLTKRSNTGSAEATWTPDEKVGYDDAPSVTSAGPSAYVAGNDLYIVYRDDDSSRNGQLMVSRKISDQWYQPYGLADQDSGSPPSILSYGGKIICVRTPDTSSTNIYTVALKVESQMLQTDGSAFTRSNPLSKDGPTLVKLPRRNGTGDVLYMIYRGIGDEAWLYFSRFDQKDPFSDSAWVDEARVGTGDETHYCFFECGADSFNYNP